MTISRKSVGLAFLSLAASAAVTGCAHEPQAMPVQPVPSGPTSQVSPSEVRDAVQNLPDPDRSFVQQATGVSAAAIEMGRLAMVRGSTPDIQNLGRALVDEHTRLADQLRQSTAQNGITLPYPSMTDDQRTRFNKLQQLYGTDFDHQFLDTIKDLQQQTIDSFQKEAMKGQVPGLQTLANQSLPGLNDRVRTVQRELSRF